MKKNNVIRWKRWSTLAACLVLVVALGVLIGTGSFRVGSMAPTSAEKSAPSGLRSPESAVEAEEPMAEAAPGNAPAYNSESNTVLENSQYAGIGTGGSDQNKADAPQSSTLPGVESVPSPAPEAEPSDNGFGNRTPVPSKLPGIGEGGLSGLSAPTARYLRVGYGTTPPPSAVVISSAASLEAYLKGFGTNQYDGEGNPVPNEALEELKKTYGEDWFADRSLVAVVAVSGSGSTRYEVLSVAHDCVNIRTIVPEVGTADMAAWLIIVELDTVLDDGAVLDVNYSF